MNSLALLSCCSLLAIGVRCPAQGTYVVNPSGFGGFNDITTAVASVPDGSTLLVFPGTYAPVVIDGKSVSILCSDNVFANGSIYLEIKNLTASQRSVVRGLRPASAASGIFVRDVAGHAAIDNPGTQLVLTGPGALASPCVVVNVAQFFLRGFVFVGETGSSVAASHVVFESCTFTASNPVSGNGSGLSATDSNVQALRCSFTGANGLVIPKLGTYPGGPGVLLINSVFRAAGRSTDRIVAGSTPAVLGFTVPPIDGSGNARVEPAILLIGAPVVLPMTRPQLPSLLATSAPPGGVMQVTRLGAIGIAYAIAISLPAPTSNVLGVVDPVWLDLNAMYVEGFGISYGTNQFQLQKPVPSSVSLRGLEVVWQSFDFNLGGEIAASNASVAVIQ
jgi:hypothetical protein